jgi:ATP-dependent DNA helicase RecG
MALIKSKGISVDKSIDTFLEKFALVREGRPTFGAYLMFMKARDGLTAIELGRFQDAITIKDDITSKSDIISQVDEVIEFVKKHINCELVISGVSPHVRKWQYPLDAIREIVLNMIIHRDYRSTSSSIVKIFNDKIEFYNPGRLPENITVEKLLSNDYKSTPRNKKIAEFFKEMGWIERYGSGIGRIIN